MEGCRVAPENASRADGRAAGPRASPYVSRVAMNPCQAARPFLAERCASKVLRSVSWLTASGECNSPALIPPSRSVRFSGFRNQLAVHSGGTAPESHRTSQLRPNGHLRTGSRVPQSAAAPPRERVDTNQELGCVRHGMSADPFTEQQRLARETPKEIRFAPTRMARQGACQLSRGASGHFFKPGCSARLGASLRLANLTVRVARTGYSKVGGQAPLTESRGPPSGSDTAATSQPSSSGGHPADGDLQLRGLGRVGSAPWTREPGQGSSPTKLVRRGFRAVSAISRANPPVHAAVPEEIVSGPRGGPGSHSRPYRRRSHRPRPERRERFPDTCIRLREVSARHDLPRPPSSLGTQLRNWHWRSLRASTSFHSLSRECPRRPALPDRIRAGSAGRPRAWSGRSTACGLLNRHTITSACSSWYEDAISAAARFSLVSASPFRPPGRVQSAMAVQSLPIRVR